MWTRTEGGSPIIPTPRTLKNISWYEPDVVLIQFIIKKVTSKDSGMYYCSLQYDDDIINGSKVESEKAGKINLQIGSTL